MVEYDFHTLSPTDFELLVCELLRAREGINFKAFDHGPDGGVDLLAPLQNGNFIVQCKHYRGSSFSDLLKSAKVEKLKMDRKVPAKYIFATSQKLTYSQQLRLADALSPWATGVESIAARKDLNIWLTENPQVEQRNFKLWMASADVLRRIVDNGTWARSEVLLEQIQDRVQRYVDNSDYYEAREMLDSKRVCVIVGAPGVGKSTIAEMLTLTHWNEEWRIITLDSHEISRCWDVWDANERQFFYFDDVFGQTDISESLGRQAGKVIARLVKGVNSRPNKRLLITSRTHILRDAQARDEDVVRAGLTAHECVVKLTDYTITQKAQILCNHLYFSSIDRSLIRRFARERKYRPLVSHRNFTPRIIEQTIVQYEAEQVGGDLDQALHQALERPVLLWQTSFQHSITESARQLLLILVAYPVAGMGLNEVRSLLEAEFKPEEVSRALKQLEGSWIRIFQSHDTKELLVRFNDPSCRDFILALLDDEPSRVLRLLRKLPRLESMVRILKYGFPGNYTEPKCPGIASAVERNWNEVFRLIQSHWTRPGLDRSASVVIKMIDAYVSFLKMFEGKEFDLGFWLLDQLFKGLPLVDPEVFDSYQALQFITAWPKSPAPPRERTRTASMARFLESAIAQLPWGEDAQWRAIHEAIEWLAAEADQEWIDICRNGLRERYLFWLDHEVDSVIEQFPDRTGAVDRISIIRQDADDILGDGVFDNRFPRIIADIDRYFYSDSLVLDEDEDDDSVGIPAARLTSSVTNFPRYREDPQEQIDVIFRILE